MFTLDAEIWDGLYKRSRSMLRSPNFDQLYYWTLSELMDAPDYVCSPRGMKINENICFRGCLLDPRKRLLTCEARKANYGFAVGEFLWYWRGAEDLESILYYNKRMGAFSNDGKTINSAYGKRMKTAQGDGLSQWETCKRTLVKDPDSRRAVMLINQPQDELVADVNGSKDVPCTLSLQFFVREKRLHLHVNMRSNDIVWGFTNDLFSFTLFQECMLLELQQADPKFADLQLGRYFHTAGSMHVYDTHFQMARDIVAEYDKKYAMFVRKSDPRPMWDSIEGMGPIDLDDLKTLVVDEEALRLGNIKKITVGKFASSGVRWMAEMLNGHREKRDNEEKK